MKSGVISLTNGCLKFASQSFCSGRFMHIFFKDRVFKEKHCTFYSAGARPFPDYTPRKPTIRDSEVVQGISKTIKQRRFETLRHVLRPFESKFKPDHLIWVLMNIKDDYELVFNFYEWACLHREPSLEIIAIHIAVA